MFEYVAKHWITWFHKADFLGAPAHFWSHYRLSRLFGKTLIYHFTIFTSAQVYLVCQTNISFSTPADCDRQTSQLHLITVWNQEHYNPSRPPPPTPSRSQPPHPRRPPPAVRVGCSEARASKQGGSSAAGVWASTVAQRAAALDSLWQLRRAAAVYNSCGNCRRDNRFPNSDARCALVPADTVLPEKACVQCFARITRPFNSYSQITFLG